MARACPLDSCVRLVMLTQPVLAFYRATFHRSYPTFPALLAAVHAYFARLATPRAGME